jgi:hypothetical protein
MSDSPEMFDPYWEWLEIPAEDQPPTFYRLLGLDDFEDDLAAIDAAAKQTTAYLHPMAAGPNRESVQQLLSEVAKARRTLLGSDAKRAYDEDLQAVESTPEPPLPPPVPPSLSAPTGEQPEDAGNPPPKPNSACEDQAEQQPEPVQRLRRKSLVNDWRVHVASASVLFFGAIGFVLYNNSKAVRVASVAASVPESRRDGSAKRGRTAPAPQRGDTRQTKTNGSRNTESAVQNRVMGGAPPKKKPRPAGKSALELMLAQDGLSMESSLGHPDAMRPAGAEGKAKLDTTSGTEGNLPENASVTLPTDWLAGLQMIDEFEKPVGKEFNVSKMKAAFAAVDGHLVVQPVTPPGKVGVLTLKESKLALGETVVLKTSLNDKTTTKVRVGLRVGELRVNLCPKTQHVEVRCNGKLAGQIACSKQNGITLAVTRDSKDGKKFHWIAQSGSDSVAGRGTFAAEISDPATLGILAMCGEEKPNVAVTIEEFGFGKLETQVELSETKRLEFSMQGK